MSYHTCFSFSLLRCHSYRVGKANTKPPQRRFHEMHSRNPWYLYLYHLYLYLFFSKCTAGLICLPLAVISDLTAVLFYTLWEILIVKRKPLKVAVYRRRIASGPSSAKKLSDLSLSQISVEKTPQFFTHGFQKNSLICL
jgi:hypothetical protein